MADRKKAASKPASNRARRPAPGVGKRSAAGPKSGRKKPGKAAAPARTKAPARVRPAKADRGGKRARSAKAVSDAALLPGPEPGLSEEDAIRSAKYTPRNLPPRLFEEERFLFPESYGVDRIRLLVRDPEWLFAYWDVSPKSLANLRRQVGDRAAAVARLTLRIADPVSGGASDILLPPGARWWYVRADSARRSYRAELGFTLASGEFRTLAGSNTVTTPRVGQSSEGASRRLSYRQAGEIPPAAGAAVRQEEMRSGSANGPWSAPNLDGASDTPAPSAPDAPGGESARKGGASDAFRPGGASDVHRR
jgi:hypothetical protein